MSPLRVESGPQRLKPDLFSIRYVRAEARTLQQPEFSAACKPLLRFSVMTSGKLPPLQKRSDGPDKLLKNPVVEGYGL
jgi:hypothetical protein